MEQQKQKAESIYAISNYEHEYYLNEKKRQIVIPRASMVDLMVEEIEELVQYEPHTENLMNLTIKRLLLVLHLDSLIILVQQPIKVLSQPKKLVILPSIMVKLLAPMQV